MPRERFSLRITIEMLERLDAASQRTGQTRAELVRTLVEEGLRMADHPGIIFRPGPVGRRPGLVMGPDVWEVMSVFRRIDATGEQALEQTAELTGLRVEQVRTAVHYYAEYTDEINAWIAKNDELAEQAEAIWLREQAILQR